MMQLQVRVTKVKNGVGWETVKFLRILCTPNHSSPVDFWLSYIAVHVSHVDTFWATVYTECVCVLAAVKTESGQPVAVYPWHCLVPFLAASSTSRAPATSQQQRHQQQPQQQQLAASSHPADTAQSLLAPGLAGVSDGVWLYSLLSLSLFMAHSPWA